MPTDEEKACVLDELRKISATGFVANGASIRDSDGGSSVLSLLTSVRVLFLTYISKAVSKRLGTKECTEVLGAYPFQAGVIAGATMQFVLCDSPLDTPAPLPGVYTTGCSGGDGFLLEHEGELHLLYVEQMEGDGPETQGRYVRKVTVDDLTGNITLSDPVKTNLDAIRFFPYPFRWEENWYILNGFDLAGGIPGIYKCTSFPETWELVHAVPAALGTHTHAIVRGGKLYIFVPWDGDDGEHELKLYVADSPTAGWNEHPSSPLYKGVPWGSHAGGGAAVEHDGRLYRLVQDCRGWYGQCVRAFEVTELSETMFSEMLVSGAPLAGAVGEGAAAVGMHVVSHAQLASGMWLRASDAWKTHSTSATTVPPPLSSPPPPPSSSTAAPEPPHPFPQRAFMMGQDFLPEVRQELVKRSIPVVDLVTPRDAANWSELLRAELQSLGLGATDVVVALPNWVDVALEVLGIAVPVPPDYPECLAHLLQRKVWQSSLGDVEAALGAGEHTQLFIKPAEGAKAFSGTVVHGPADGMLAMLLDTSIFPACGAALAVHCSEVKEMNSEYAVYVVDGKIRSICHYMCKTSTCRCENGERAAAGDAVIQLDMGVVHEAVQLLADCDAMRALTGYRADFALVRKETGADGTGGGVDAGDSYVTALVEVNDGYVSGRYDSMLPSDFTDMIVSRFRSLQLTIAAAP